jgi:hypothetical protein
VRPSVASAPLVETNSASNTGDHDLVRVEQVQERAALGTPLDPVCDYYDAEPHPVKA